VPSWNAVTRADIDRDLIFTRLPSDDGVVTPIAPMDEDTPPDVSEQLERVRGSLPAWRPARIADTVQRVRNVLYVAAVPDVLQIPIERYVARVVYEHLEQDVPKADLMKALYWIALHPGDGDDSAVDDLSALGMDERPPDREQIRERAALYAVKLLGRLTGDIREK
jgi:hypothetical protein